MGRGSEEWIKYLQCIIAGCRDVVLCGSLETVVSGDFASGCLHAVGFVGVIARVGCFCLGLRSAYGEPSESVVIGEVGGSLPPIMRPGLASGRAAAAGVASCTRRRVGGPTKSVVTHTHSDSSVSRLAARVSCQWQGWQLAAPRARQLCDPGQHPGGPLPPGLPAAPGGPPS